MKTILKALVFLAIGLPLSTMARPIAFAWNPNPIEEMIEGYRIEKFDIATNQWVSMGVTDGITHTLRVAEFPETLTKVRAIAINYYGESDSSAELTIPIKPSPPGGLRITITSNAVNLALDNQGRFITIQQSNDLRYWWDIGSGYSFLKITLPLQERAFFRTTST